MMTIEDLHKAVETMTHTSAGLIVPTSIRVEFEIHPIDLLTFLMDSTQITHVSTPTHNAHLDEQGRCYVVRKGSVAYSDGI